LDYLFSFLGNNFDQSETSPKGGSDYLKDSQYIGAVSDLDDNADEEEGSEEIDEDGESKCDVEGEESQLGGREELELESKKLENYVGEISIEFDGKENGLGLSITGVGGDSISEAASVNALSSPSSSSRQSESRAKSRANEKVRAIVPEQEEIYLQDDAFFQGI
jgi:hypothetical protein